MGGSEGILPSSPQWLAVDSTPIVQNRSFPSPKLEHRQEMWGRSDGGSLIKTINSRIGLCQVNWGKYSSTSPFPTAIKANVKRYLRFTRAFSFRWTRVPRNAATYNRPHQTLRVKPPREGRFVSHHEPDHHIFVRLRQSPKPLTLNGKENCSNV
jgi:hypothetical protein